MGGVCSGPVGFEITERERKQCTVLETARGVKPLLELAKLGVPFRAAEVVVYVRPASKKFAGDPTAVTPDQLKQILRALFLTPGTVQLMSRRGFAKYPSCRYALRKLRLVAYDETRDLMILAAGPVGQSVPPHITMYQTPFPSRFLYPLAQALADAFVGVPPWAVPVQIKPGSLALPASTAASQEQALGKDGGFSSCFAAHTVATVILQSPKPERKLSSRKALNVRQIISSLVANQQPQNLPWSKGHSYVLDVGALVTGLLAQIRPISKIALCDSLILGALDCLAFNLEFRKLRMHNLKLDFQVNLARIFLYNVTLRDIDLAGTSLHGMGRDLGRALSMNIQPLVSNLDLSGCKLGDVDWNGLVVGLARLWCGGSATLQALSVANNKDVKALSWGAFWDLLVDPSTFEMWPSSPPPPPNLCFLQHLDVTETTAAGFSLARLIRKLEGLRSLRLGGGTSKFEDVDIVLQAVAKSDAPLETFYGKCLQLTTSKNALADALHHHSGTLKQVELEDFSGNALRLICLWPSRVPKVSLEFKGDLKKAQACSTSMTSLSHDHFSPGTIILRGKNHRSFVRDVLSTLASRATGLISLYIHGVRYADIAREGSETQLATCGLKVLHVTWPPSERKDHGRSRRGSSCDWKLRQQFWSVLALSKTLEEIWLPNQLEDCTCENHEDEVAMIGRFLKTNRSVRRINFDSDALTLNVESVKILRSAFYGNKKVVSMVYPVEAKARTMAKARQTTLVCTREVADAKRSIKQIFKSHYDKYDRNWRAKPNRLKVPHVERIRTAKRKIGKTNRDATKIGGLLQQVKVCVQKNNDPFRLSLFEKKQSKLARRETQLTKMAVKQNQVMGKLVTRLHRAKIRGRKKRSGKEHVPRSYYYKDRHNWPGRRFERAESSHYRRWNDPYNARFTYAWLWYHDRDREGEQFPTQATPEIEVSEEGDEPEIFVCGDEEPAEDVPVGAAWPPYVIDIEDIDLACSPNLVESRDPGIFPDLSSTVDDPWAPIDELVTANDPSSDKLFSDAYLSQLHMEAAELGLDVLADVQPILDVAASLNDKVDDIAITLGVDPSDVVASVPVQSFDATELLSVLPEVGAYDLEEADDAVEMYAGAGPRDLDDGGPFFGDGSIAVEAGARRRARTRKNNRVQRRVRLSACRRQRGYRSLSLTPNIFVEDCASSESEAPFRPWPDNISGSWKDDVTAAQIEIISQSDVLSLPEISSPVQVLEWSHMHNVADEAQSQIDVALVTQCSVDRLDNLRDQLAAWNGKASVAVYVKNSELSSKIDAKLLSLVNEAQQRALQLGSDSSGWDVALSIVEAHGEDEPYPINYLRNVALLQARSLFVSKGYVLEKTAVLLVDVDFRPSWNLHEALHCDTAADEILQKRRVVVCPAFEDSTSDNLPRNIPELREDLDNGSASGFHLSKFPQGHSPTDFEAFWSASSLQAPSTQELWSRLYPVSYQKLFEPYVVVRTPDVPLYDERFQGYGLNKVSHLAAIARQKCNELFVLPGVFLVAPCHERSQSWASIYGSASDEANFNKLYLKGLYHSFSIRLSEGKAPVVSSATKIWHEQLLEAAATKPISSVAFETQQYLS